MRDGDAGFVDRIRVDFTWVAGVLTVAAIDVGTDAGAVNMENGWYCAWGTNTTFVAGNRLRTTLYPSRDGTMPGAGSYIDCVPGKLIPGTGPSDIICQEVARS